MAENSKIEWTRHTFNPVRGCTKVSEGCANCYAETMSGRNPNLLGIWGSFGTRIVASADMWRQPLKWNKAAEKAGERHRVFCASLAGLFEEWPGMIHFYQVDEDTDKPAIGCAWYVPGRGVVPAGQTSAHYNRKERQATLQDVRDQVFALIEQTPHLDWLLLTKRPQNVLRMVPEKWKAGFPANVWIGATVENQARADERIPQLLNIPATVRFLSCEPLLGPVDLGWPIAGAPAHFWKGGKPTENDRIHWVICGGESGPGARPMHPDWARSLRDQCSAAGVPFFFKQWGEWLYPPDIGLSFDDFPKAERGQVWTSTGPTSRKGYDLVRVGKKKAGRELDGRTHDEFPKLERNPAA